MKKTIFSLVLIFITSLTFLNISCTGFKYTLKGGTIPGKTFSIENFENRAPLGDPALNIWVQELLRDRLLKETNLKYLPEDGDANFTGTITGYTISPVVGTGQATADLNRLTITLNVSYENTVNDKNNFKKSFTDFSDFESSQDISAVEEELIETIGNKLVDQIFNQVLIDW